MNYLQQGDVLLINSGKIPEGLSSVPGNLIHAGYSHNHQIEGDFEILSNDKSFYIIAKNRCMLIHPEHKPIELSEGIYEKRIVKEYDHFLEESREVID